MSTMSWRPLLAVCAGFVSFVSFADPPTTFSDTLGATHSATEVTAPALRYPRPGSDLRSWVVHWNEVAINASGLDHTPVAPGENRVFGEQIGPGPATLGDQQRRELSRVHNHASRCDTSDSRFGQSA